MGYKPQPKRRIYIPKPGSETGRPMGISSFEDKMVELTTKRVLEPLFEPLFENCSDDYRPQRSPHQCLDALGRTLQQKQVNILVEADIRGFFDAVHHEWLLKFLRQRIGDERVLRLISRMVKAGIMEDGLVQAAEVGTPQGSILSPLLSNVYGRLFGRKGIVASLLPMSPRESRFSMTYSHPYESNPMTWRSP
jgi:RNA-directed DNA polymerase